MKRVYTAKHPADAHMLKDLLIQNGIQAVVRGEDLFGARGEAPLTIDTLPHVWVLDEADFDKARAIVHDYEKPAAGDVPSWRCTQCGEEVEGQFGACWNCGSAAPA